MIRSLVVHRILTLNRAVALWNKCYSESYQNIIGASDARRTLDPKNGVFDLSFCPLNALSILLFPIYTNLSKNAANIYLSETPPII